MLREPRIGLFLSAITLLGAACGPSQEDFDRESARAAELSTQLETARQERATLDSELAQLRANNQTMADRLTQMGADVESLRGQTATLETDRASLQATLTETQRALEELRERDRQAQARLAEFRGLLDRFRSMISSGQLRIRIDRNRMIVQLPAGVLFQSGSSVLKPEGQQAIAQVAQVLRQIPDREFQIAGHTDNVPIRGGDNWTLSSARAVTVLRFMVDSQVPATRLSAAGYADTQPVASNDTEEGRQQNRRIDIVLLPNLNELPDLHSLEQATH